MEIIRAGSLQERQDVLKDSQQQNAVTPGPKYRVLRFYLDTAADRFTYGDTGHYFGSGIKSFWVCDTNNRQFVARIVPNPTMDRTKGSGLPLRFNMNISYAFPVHDACLEFDSQPGVWVDIAFSESEDIAVGSVEATLSASVEIDEGASFVNTKMSATTTAAELLPADTTRIKATFQHKSGGSVWIGTQAQLSDADWKNLGVEIQPGAFVELHNKAQWYFKSDVAGVLLRTVYKA